MNLQLLGFPDELAVLIMCAGTLRLYTHPYNPGEPVAVRVQRHGDELHARVGHHQRCTKQARPRLESARGFKIFKPNEEKLAFKTNLVFLFPSLRTLTPGELALSIER